MWQWGRYITGIYILLGGWGIFAQQVGVELQFASERPNSYQYVLRAGIAFDATICLDTALEVEIPLLPPEGMFPVFLLPCTDTITGVPIMTQEDFRPVPHVSDSVVHQIHIQRDGYPLHIRWTVASIVDSARLADPFEVYVYNLTKEDSAVIDNNAVGELSLQIWYRASVSRVVEHSQVFASSPALCVPREQRWIQIQRFRSLPFAQGELRDLNGRLVAKIPLRQGKGQLPSVNLSGVYVLSVKQQGILLLIY